MSYGWGMAHLPLNRLGLLTLLNRMTAVLAGGFDARGIKSPAMDWGCGSLCIIVAGIIVPA